MIASGRTAVCRNFSRSDRSRHPDSVSGRKTNPQAFRKGDRLVDRLVAKSRLIEAQLIHAQRMETLSRMLPGVVHDFNLLLTHIIGYTELSLANLSPGDRNQGNLERVREAGKKATDLTKKLLSQCRPQGPRAEALDVSAVVESAGRLFQRILGGDVPVEFKLLRTLRPIMADPIQIEQVLLNLVANARDAVPAGGRITVETDDVDLEDRNSLGLPPGGYVIIAVEDTGPGIPAEIRDRVFEPFFTTKGDGRGTGLGLSTVTRIVQGHGGRVVLDSTDGSGSRFSVYLPVVRSDFFGEHGEPSPAGAVRAVVSGTGKEDKEPA